MEIKGLHKMGRLISACLYQMHCIKCGIAGETKRFFLQAQVWNLLQHLNSSFIETNIKSPRLWWLLRIHTTSSGSGKTFSALQCIDYVLDVNGTLARLCGPQPKSVRTPASLRVSIDAALFILARVKQWFINLVIFIDRYCTVSFSDAFGSCDARGAARSSGRFMVATEFMYQQDMLLSGTQGEAGWCFNTSWLVSHNRKLSGLVSSELILSTRRKYFASFRGSRPCAFKERKLIQSVVVAVWYVRQHWGFGPDCRIFYIYIYIYIYLICLIYLSRRSF
eukprot:284818839_2